MAQGRENAKEYLREHPDCAAEVEADIRAILAPEEVEEADDELEEEGGEADES
jgi:hypothetical protein